jgi:hypothetical protein
MKSKYKTSFGFYLERKKMQTKPCINFQKSGEMTKFDSKYEKLMILDILRWYID